MDQVLLDLSGHLLKDGVIELLGQPSSFAQIIHLSPPHLPRDEDPSNQLENFIIQIAEKLSDTSGRVSVILPTHPITASIVLVALQGYLNYLPTIVLMKVDANGLYEEELVTLQTSEFKEIIRRDNARPHQLTLGG